VHAQASIYLNYKATIHTQGRRQKNFQGGAIGKTKTEK